MRVVLLIVWILIPVAVMAYHFGPGQQQLKNDQVAALLHRAEALVKQESWAEAQPLFEQALELLPDDRVATQRRVRLERAKCQLENKQLPEANEDLKTLVNELAAEPPVDADPKLLAEARAALANSQYYIAWLMRLEGLSRDQWEPEITASQQLFRLLANEASASNDDEMKVSYQKDLESAVKLARLDLGELQGLPLPCQCKGCCSKCSRPTKKPGKKKPQPEDARGASAGAPPDDGGS